MKYLYALVIAHAAISDGAMMRSHAEDELLVTPIMLERSPHALSWHAGKDPPHMVAQCIHPAPFGKQCTRHSTGALRACLEIEGCTSLVCPDAGPYLKDTPQLRKKGIHGAICQVRSHNNGDEKNHGMCRPGGCAHVTFDAPVALMKRPHEMTEFDTTSEGVSDGPDIEARKWLAEEVLPPGARFLAVDPNLVHAASEWDQLTGILEGFAVMQRIGHWRAPEGTSTHANGGGGGRGHEHARSFVLYVVAL
jgi:hypothetical protein